MKTIADYRNPANPNIVTRRENYHKAHIGEATNMMQAAGVPPLYADYDTIEFRVPPVIGGVITGAISRITPPGLYLYGTGGTGKTVSAAAYCRELCLIGVTCKWWSVVQLSGALRENQDDAARIINEAQTVPHLFLDDLAADRKTEWWYETLYRIISYRFDNVLPVTVTLNPTESGVDTRITRRLTEFAVCVELK